MTQDDRKSVAGVSKSDAAVSAFLAEAAATSRISESGRGRLILALDATMSRQPTWDLAQALQARMFDVAASLGGLDVQLVFFRGFAECKASRFVADGRGLSALMSAIAVRGGRTQIGRVLEHARDETRRARVGALVYVGDAMEESIDDLANIAGELGLLGTKGFFFHEGHDAVAGGAFREFARLTGGVYAAFDKSAPERLASLLSAAASYAAGGYAALQRQAEAGDSVATQLLGQMHGGNR